MTEWCRSLGLLAGGEVAGGSGRQASPPRVISCHVAALQDECFGLMGWGRRPNASWVSVANRWQLFAAKVRKTREARISRGVASRWRRCKWRRLRPLALGCSQLPKSGSRTFKSTREVGPGACEVRRRPEETGCGPGATLSPPLRRYRVTRLPGSQDAYSARRHALLCRRGGEDRRRPVLPSPSWRDMQCRIVSRIVPNRESGGKTVLGLGWSRNAPAWRVPWENMVFLGVGVDQEWWWSGRRDLNP